MDKFIQTRLFLLSALLLLESWAVYHWESSTLDEASQTGKRVLMITSDNKKVKLKRIVKTDSAYVGVLKGSNRKIVLDSKNIKDLRTIDPGLTTLGNLGIALLFAGVIAIGIFAVNYDPLGGFSFGDE